MKDVNRREAGRLDFAALAQLLGLKDPASSYEVERRLTLTIDILALLGTRGIAERRNQVFSIAGNTSVTAGFTVPENETWLCLWQGFTLPIPTVNNSGNQYLSLISDTFALGVGNTLIGTMPNVNLEVASSGNFAAHVGYRFDPPFLLSANDQLIWDFRNGGAGAQNFQNCVVFHRLSFKG
jgi:hypothetical protein